MITYKKYLHTPYWKQRRLEAIHKANNKCRFCHKQFNDNELQVHHKNYQHFFNEKDKYLIVLCEECHHKLHEGIKNKTRTWGGGYKKKKLPSHNHKRKE